MMAQFNAQPQIAESNIVAVQVMESIVAPYWLVPSA
jgi:hypothetical protein